MNYASIWDLFIVFGIPFLLWYTVGRRFVAWWETFRGLTGLHFLPKKPNEPMREDPPE